MRAALTRENIVKVADNLFYQQGFEHTSFADIAKEVRISRGNFYYHFRTKDEILDAVIEKRLSDRMMIMEKWEIEGDLPQDRIRYFISILLTNSCKIKQYGCPIGTLTSELAKLNHHAAKDACELFTIFRVWLRRQFEQAGHKAKADEYALHVLAHSQGVATLANAFHDDAFINREVENLIAWLNDLPKSKVT